MRTNETADAEKAGRVRFRWVIFLAAVGILNIVIYGFMVDITRLHLFGLHGTFVDQEFYIDAARHVIDEGKLDSTVIWTSTLNQVYHRNYFYMPGHALAIAVSYRIMGESPVTSILPGVFAYLGCIALLYIIGSRLVNRRVGSLSGFLFAIFPPSLIYGFSAMSEMTLLCACLAAFTAFLYLPVRYRHVAGPLLLCVPFLFRETGPLWIVPMVAVMLTETRGPKWKTEVIAFIGISLILLLAIYRLDWIQDRPSLFYQNLLSKTFGDKYMDAFAALQKPSSITEWAEILVARGLQNLRTLVRILLGRGDLLEILLLHLLLWPPLLVLLTLRWMGRLRNLVFAYAVMAVVLFGAITFLYHWETYIGIRQAMLISPLGAIAAGCFFDRLCPDRRRLASVVVVITTLMLPISLAAAVSINRSDSKMKYFELVLQTIDIDQRGTLISSHEFGVPYLYRNRRGKWAYMPANEKTLLLLQKKYPVSAVIYFYDNELKFRVATLKALGLRNERFINGPDGSIIRVLTW